MTTPSPDSVWTDSLDALFDLLNKTVKEEEGPEWKVPALRLRVSMKRADGDLFPRRVLTLSRQPAPMDAAGVRHFQESCAALMRSAWTPNGVDWLKLDDDDSGERIVWTYLELFAGEKAPGELPCRCGQRNICPGIPSQCIETAAAYGRQTLERMKPSGRAIPEPFGARD